MLAKYIRKIVIREHERNEVYLEAMCSNVEKLKTDIDMINTSIEIADTLLDEMWEKQMKLKNEIEQTNAELSPELKKQIDDYVQQSVKIVISQGNKCSVKLSNKEQTFEDKVLIAQGKIKRELPIIKERIGMLEDKINSIELME